MIESKNKSAIEFGCGTGLVGLSLLKDFKSILFWDSSQNMLDQVNRKISHADVQNADTLCFDLEQDSLPGLCADVIFMAQVLLHIKDFESLLYKLYDVLNPGGHLLIIDFNKNAAVVSELVHSGFYQDELKDMMRNIGYKSIQAKTFYHGSQIFMGFDASLFILDSQKSSN